MRVISCEEILGRNDFKSYSEFILMMCIGKEYHRRGCLFDVSTMRITDILGGQQKLMLRWLVYKGIVYAGDVGVPEPTEKEPYSFNMDAITANEGRLFEDFAGSDTEEPCYRWSNSWAKAQHYEKYDNDLYLLQYLEIILLHLVAHMIVSIKEGTAEDKPIKIIIDGMLSNSTDNYVNLVSCKRTLPWFDKMVKLDIDLRGKHTDVDFSLFVNNGIVAGRREWWSISEKQKQMKREGICEGSICILFERGNLAETNLIGKISNANIVRVNKIEKDRVYMTIIPLYKTKEEIEDDFMDIPEESQPLFTDMLEFRVNLSDRCINLCSLGISNYLYSEELFIVPIDSYGTVTKVITVDGVRGAVELSQIDAIYWLLCQYGIEFNRELYKSMYNNGKDLLWDDYGSPV